MTAPPPLHFALGDGAQRCGLFRSGSTQDTTDHRYT